MKEHFCTEFDLHLKVCDKSESLSFRILYFMRGKISLGPEINFVSHTLYGLYQLIFIQSNFIGH